MNDNRDNQQNLLSNLSPAWQIAIKIIGAFLLLALIALFVWGADWLIAYIKDILF
ncbi:MAG: hypothetical protein IJL87_03340 [Clostridia bacterium]|nr:hypothetical protein [Clostridia bacterium]